MANALLFLSVIWLRLQTWWSTPGVPSLAAISIPLDSLGLSHDAVFESGQWLNDFLAFLNVPRPGLISALSNDEGVALSIHMPLSTELLAPLCLSSNTSNINTTPRLNFQRPPLPPSSTPTDASRTIHVDEHAAPSETAAGGTFETGCDANEADAGSDSGDASTADDKDKWSRLPKSQWLAWFLSGQAQIPVGASWSYDIGPLTFKIPQTLLQIIGLLVTVSIIVWRVCIHVSMSELSELDISCTRAFSSVEVSSPFNAIDDFFISSLVADTTAKEEAVAPVTSDEVSNAGILVGFRFVVVVLRARIANLASNVQGLAQQNASFLDEIATLEQWNAALKNTNEAQTSQLDALRKERDDARGAMKELESEEQDYQDQMQGILEHNVSLGNQVERLGQDKGALQATIATLTQENERLRAEARRCRGRGQGHTATIKRSSTLPATAPSEATSSSAPAAPALISLGGSPVPSASSMRGSSNYPRAGGTVLYGPPRLNSEGIPTRPMTPQEREDRRAAAAAARPDVPRGSVGDSDVVVAGAPEEIVAPMADDEVQGSAGQENQAATVADGGGEGRGLEDSRWAKVDGGPVGDKGKGKAEEGEDEVTDGRRRSEGGEKGREEMKRSKWAS
ncbi:hypothetical protein PV08_04345 [Exophiala spinifera]|uniref:Peroxin-14 n=1 Tax=Exophiala spinifera TaxID=91928 RepID=A0A0D2C0I5_9EURO|nr:uncharacterized protein PV08_04345 [Exophiala spinifera]KIW17154.1 hypothetical protein PV08_04345 [Exophiala spinifera]